MSFWKTALKIKIETAQKIKETTDSIKMKYRNNLILKQKNKYKTIFLIEKKILLL